MKSKKKYCTAIVLSAGSGKRMGTAVQKQYLLLKGKPVIYYSLKAFEESEIIDEIILVAGADDEDFCRKNIVERYGFSKVSRIVAGGAERYHSVWNGLKETKEDGYVYIHDGARPFVDGPMIMRAYECVDRYSACAAGMPAKDTIKIVDKDCFVKDTPDRNFLWLVQTPQVFEVGVVKKAYEMLFEKAEAKNGNACINRLRVTDDAMVVETMSGKSVKLFHGSYENLKITTPEDMGIAEALLNKKDQAPQDIQG